MVCTNPWVVWQSQLSLAFCPFITLYDLFPAAKKRKFCLSLQILSIISGDVIPVELQFRESIVSIMLSIFWYISKFYILSYIAKFLRSFDLLTICFRNNHTFVVSVSNGQPFVSIEFFVYFRILSVFLVYILSRLSHCMKFIMFHSEWIWIKSMKIQDSLCLLLLLYSIVSLLLLLCSPYNWRAVLQSLW